MLGHFFFTFNKVIWDLRSSVLAQLVLILAGAMVITGVENIPAGDAIYFAFITALTIGYGDIVATTVVGRIACVFIGFVGITFAGIIVVPQRRMENASFPVVHDYQDRFMAISRRLARHILTRRQHRHLFSRTS